MTVFILMRQTIRSQKISLSLSLVFYIPFLLHDEPMFKYFGHLCTLFSKYQTQLFYRKFLCLRKLLISSL